jgi:hypothetical protein
MTDQLQWDYDRIRAYIREQRKLGNRLVRSDMLALHENNDPFYQGHPTQHAEAKWFPKAWKRCLQSDATRKLNLRRVHYFLSSLGNYKKLNGKPYANTNADWDWLQACSKSARVIGTVDLDEFEDKRNADVGELNWRSGSSVPRVIEGNLTCELPRIQFNASALDVDWNISNALPAGYDPNESVDREYYLECWPEKSTPDDVLEPICNELRIPYLPSTGYQSVTNIKNLLRRIERIGKPARLFYISDFDPAGRNMPCHTARWMEYFIRNRGFAPGIDIKVVAVVLTAEQIKKYTLPQTEDGKVELDSLEAIVPGELGKILRRAVSKYVEPMDYRLEVAEREARKTVQQEWDALMQPHRRDLARLRKQAATITRKYQKQAQKLADGLNKRLQRDLKSFQKPLAQLRSGVDAVRFNPELPARPRQNLEPPDEASALFDIKRKYEDQLPFYKKQKGERP